MFGDYKLLNKVRFGNKRYALHSAYHFVVGIGSEGFIVTKRVFKIPWRALRKIVIGIVLLFIAASISVFIKESLDTLDPESSLPILTVQQNGQTITDVYRAGYVWSFFTTVERRAPEVTEADIPLVPVPVPPQAVMTLQFSTEPSSLRVFRADNLLTSGYYEIADEDVSSFHAPNAPGIYVYKILAQWGNRGNIQYYFAIQVTA